MVPSEMPESVSRIAALAKLPVTYIFTHDSVGVGEDGPTHQPVEHVASLRAIPNLLVMRPGDGTETSGAYKVAVSEKKRPTLLALSRQNLPNLAGTSLEGVAKGAYIITDSEGTPDVILIGTGGELYLCDKAAAVLKEAGIKARVVSMPCWELFEEQSAEYKESVLPKAVKKRLAVEAGSTMGWHRYITDEGDVLGVDTFGASAPGGVILEKFGFTVDNVVAKAKALLG